MMIINLCGIVGISLGKQVHGITEKVLVKFLVEVEQQPHVGIFDRHPRKYDSALYYRLRLLTPILFTSFHRNFFVYHNNSLGSLILKNLRGIRQVCECTSGDIKKPLADNSSGILC